MKIDSLLLRESECMCIKEGGCKKMHICLCTFYNFTNMDSIKIYHVKKNDGCNLMSLVPFLLLTKMYLKQGK